MKFAIIGAGLSSLSLASFLKDYGKVTIFEKSRGSGAKGTSFLANNPKTCQSVFLIWYSTERRNLFMKCKMLRSSVRSEGRWRRF